MDNTFSTLMSDRNPTYYMKNLGLHSREIEFNQKKYLIWSTLWDKLYIIAKKKKRKKKCNVYLAYLVIVNISGSDRLEATVFCGKGQIQWEKQCSCLTWKLHWAYSIPLPRCPQTQTERELLLDSTSLLYQCRGNRQSNPHFSFRRGNCSCIPFCSYKSRFWAFHLATLGLWMTLALMFLLWAPI